MQIYSAMDLKAGKKAEYNKMGTLTQPIQFLPENEKDDEWRAWNLDWLEWQGMKQLRRNARRLMKNYKLAKGIIDKTDYIVEEDNEMADLIDQLTKEDQSALELKFYPIIPNVVNVLCNEFSKRSSRIMFKAVDDISYNELLEEKRKMLEDVLLQDAQQKMMMEIMNQGLDMEDEQVQQQIQEQTSPDNLKKLPEIESFFRKDYRSMIEEWASHQMSVDEERFKMQELEERGFRDMLITDREFWHFNMMEDDYELELWNPLLTFYHKSPDVRYISQGNWVGKMDMMSVSDVIDKFGWMMNQEQMEALEAIYPVRSAGYAVQGYQNDGTYYDPTRTHEWNTQMPSLGYRQFTSVYDTKFGTGDIVEWILSDSEDTIDFGKTHLLRVSQIYWKSQRKVGHLTKITEEGEILQDIVTESFRVSDKPQYNTTLYKQKTKDNLIFGEHIDWIWINETWGGIKIGPNRPAFWGHNNPGGINPIYLGLNGGKPGRLPFQFKGDATLYGCKLPVEGCVFGDRNTRSTSLVDLMKPYQIGYNIVNNQIADILVDELGTVIMLDQNSLPRHSMGEDWGKNNLAKAYVAMKNFQMLPLDTSITNNTTGASIYDLGNVIKSESIAELTGVLKNAEEKVQAQKEAEMQQQQQMQQEMLASQEKQKQMDLQFRTEQADLDRQTSITVAEIRAAGYGAGVDINQNEMSDYQDALEKIRGEQRYQDQMNLKRESEMNKKIQTDQKLSIDREKLQTQKQIADKQLQIAKENKNKYDSGKKGK